MLTSKLWQTIRYSACTYAFIYTQTLLRLSSHQLLNLVPNATCQEPIASGLRHSASAFTETDSGANLPAPFSPAAGNTAAGAGCRASPLPTSLLPALERGAGSRPSHVAAYACNRQRRAADIAHASRGSGTKGKAPWVAPPAAAHASSQPFTQEQALSAFGGC